MYQKKSYGDKPVDLLLAGEAEKNHNVLIKDFNTFMNDHTLHRGRKHFYCYCLQAFRTAETMISYFKDCFKINGKQTIKMSKKGEYIKFKTFERKIKSPFIIYADFESTLVPGDFISSVIEESKHRNDVMKKHFKKELVMNKNIMKILRTLLNVGSVIMIILMVMLN